MISLFEFSQSTLSAEEDYQKLMQSYNLKTYYYSSYTYDVTSTLSKNIIDHWSEQNLVNPPDLKNKEHHFQKPANILGFENVFLWNKFVLQDFNDCTGNKKWILPIINGYCEQRKIKTDALFFSICLIGRRSNQYSGTRYLTRGINEEGFVANFVETEQIVIDLDVSTSIKPAYSSFVQIRGSIPVYWYQEPNLLVPKPPIKRKEWGC